MADPGLSPQLTMDLITAYAGELSPWALVWTEALLRTQELEMDVLVSGTLFTGRQVVKSLLAELPLPRSEAQEAVCRRLMQVLKGEGG